MKLNTFICSILFLFLSVQFTVPQETDGPVPLLQPPGASKKDFEVLREEMVGNMERRYGLENTTLIEALSSVPRHRFVPPPFTRIAYEDTTIPLGKGLTLPSPGFYIRLLKSGFPREEDKILILGYATGYIAALMSHFSNDIYVVEYSEEQAAIYREIFQTPDYTDIAMQSSTNKEAWSSTSPFDIIVVQGGIRSLPETLINQCSPNGRLLFPLADESGFQIFVMIERNGNTFSLKGLGESFLPMLENF